MLTSRSRKHKMRDRSLNFIISFLTFSFFLITATLAHAVNSQKRIIVHYEPEVVELRGTLEIQTFPGPPNYESIKDGDKTETSWYLRLPNTIDVLPTDPKSLNNSEVERNVKILQLAIGFNNSVWRKLDFISKGTSASVRGTLYHRSNGHHHSRVLLSVDQLRVEK